MAEKLDLAGKHQPPYDLEHMIDILTAEFARIDTTRLVLGRELTPRATDVRDWLLVCDACFTGVINGCFRYGIQISPTYGVYAVRWGMPMLIKIWYSTSCRILRLLASAR